MHSNPAVVISKHLTALPPALSEVRLGLTHLDAALARGLAKDRADRYPTSVDFATALRQAERAFTSAPATSRNQSARPGALAEHAKRVLPAVFRRTALRTFLEDDVDDQTHGGDGDSRPREND
jgi:serine/threonine-protein kinase